MKKNDIFEILIEDVSVSGEGIGHHEGMTFFIKGLIPGDRALCGVTKLKKTYGYARVVEILEESKDRVTPRCEKAGVCGGCQIMQMDYPAQLRMKEHLVREKLTRIGGFSTDKVDEVMQPIIGMEEPWHYRNKEQFPVGTDKDGKQKTPYIIHRTSVGCYERTLALLIEKYAGVLPLWMAPEQVRLLPIRPEHNEYAHALAERMLDMGMRVTVDDEDDNIGPKIKQARFDRVPYMFIIGDNEVKDNTVTVRSRKEGELPAMSADDALAKLDEEIRTKAK